MSIVRLDHVAVAVRDPRSAARFFGGLLEGRFMQGLPDYHGFGFQQYMWPNGSRVEVISPGSDRTGFVLRFLEKRGEGMHHMTFITDDLRAEVERFRSEGFRVVDEDHSDPNWREAFISPSSAFGCLVQLAQSDLSLEEQDRKWGGIELERVLELAVQYL